MFPYYRKMSASFLVFNTKFKTKYTTKSKEILCKFLKQILMIMSVTASKDKE